MPRPEFPLSYRFIYSPQRCNELSDDDDADAENDRDKRKNHINRPENGNSGVNK